MKRIESFCVNHLKLRQGLYLSRADGDAITYDLRMVVPNAGTYLENDGIHTFEHLLATYLRNTEYSDRVIYVGPMGCRTGFYLIFRDSVSKEEVIALVRRAMDFIADYEGEIPGSTEPECGNWKEQDLAGAKVEAKKMASVLKNWTK